ncbi:MAG TPA: GYD domain-containing protein [Chloroflexota bacterium]|nr:GYD domain-containing protein [Chloroflexota bacterium]
MPTFVSLISWTENGIKNVRDTTKRAEAAKSMARKMGGKLQTVLWTQGRYDLISIAEFPDEETAMAWLLTLGGGGNLRTETMRAYSAGDMERILAKLDGNGGGAASGAGAAKAAKS